MNPSAALLDSPPPVPHATPRSSGRVLVVIPTYCERQNIEHALTRVRAALPHADVLVVDDNSPDGTAEIVGRVGGELHQIAVLHRATKGGLGAAYRAGFAYGLHRGYDIVIEMDADLSHDPAALPALVEAVQMGADLAIGSRYVPGASIPDWSRRRRALSRCGNAYASTVLGLDVADLTSGFRAFRADALRAIDATSSHAAGYAFQIELAHLVAKAGGNIAEVPIVFTDRTEGTSKMSARITLEALALVTWWGLRDRASGGPSHTAAPEPSPRLRLS